jgi:hypothetical protein
MSWITEAINDLIIKGENELFSRIGLIEKDLKINSSETKAHFYFIKLDANGKLRKKIRGN